MCGIICYIGNKQAKPILIEGLKRLEYRGYDSAGLAIQNRKWVRLRRTKGKIAELEKKISNVSIRGKLGIAHTRWATHGEPSIENAHPQRDEDETVFIVHNGIIENYYSLKKFLEEQNIKFRSNTDTEVLAHLISLNFDGNLQEAVRRSLTQVEGTFGLAVIHKDITDEIVVARRGSPLIIGVSEHGNFVSSDFAAMSNHTNQVVYLMDDEIAKVSINDLSVSTLHSEPIQRNRESIEWKGENVELNGFPHFMLKEIYEQPEAIENAIRGRLELSEGIPKLGGIMPVWKKLKDCKHMIIVSCGTSYYAGCVGLHIFERLSEINVEVELASEFRYRKLNFSPNTFVIALSQSGETADTLAAIKEARRKGANLLGIVNVVGSSIARETDAGIYNHAGLEIGVASTKAFTSQLVILTLLALLLGRYQKLSLTEGIEVIRALKVLPELVKRILSQSDKIKSIAGKYYKFNDWLFLGRKYNYPIAMEGALKLKEISYIHAEGYPAGEIKHGAIALVNSEMPVVVIAPRDDIYDKMINNIQEVKTRRGMVIAIVTEEDDEVEKIADDIIEIPQTLDFLNPILATIPCQLLAYYCADFLGRDIDKPRNLAKSVTVE